MYLLVFPLYNCTIIQLKKKTYADQSTRCLILKIAKQTVETNAYVFLYISDAVSKWAGWAFLAQLEFGSSVTLFQLRGQIMPTTILIVPPYLKT